MKLIETIYSENASRVFLYAGIMLANIDYIGILDYTVKAILGGIVWFGFKLMNDHYMKWKHERAKAKRSIHPKNLKR